MKIFSHLCQLRIPYLETRVISHVDEVKSLYRRALKTTRSYYYERWKFRYHAVKLRKRFDDNKDVKDIALARVLLASGEKELKAKMHHQPLKYFGSPGATGYQREYNLPDVMLDYWHPLEKAMYPDYFAKREELKKEYIKLYEKTYSKKSIDSQ